MLSIITPVLNEEENIPGFLAHIDDLKGPVEVIVVERREHGRYVQSTRSGSRVVLP